LASFAAASCPALIAASVFSILEDLSLVFLSSLPFFLS